MKKSSLKPLAICIGAAFATSVSAQALAAGDNPFGATSLTAGYKISTFGDDKAKEGKCGEGKCGEKKGKEGKCGEGKCGEKGKEGKCGEGKCGEKKGKEGKCGEGKCGEKKDDKKDAKK